MPSSPELSNIPTEIRIIEVPHQAYTKELCRSDSDIRVTGEVPIDLEGKEYCSQQ